MSDSYFKEKQPTEYLTNVKSSQHNLTDLEISNQTFIITENLYVVRHEANLSIYHRELEQGSAPVASVAMTDGIHTAGSF